MAEQTMQRRLAAVLAADVAGYTARMEADEEATIAAWKTARTEIIDPSIAVIRSRHPFREEADFNHFVEGLRQAGLPEG